MKYSTFRGRVALLGLLALTALVGGLGVESKILAQADLPDLVPVFQAESPVSPWEVTTRLGFKAVEFGVLTANIGGQDFDRPRKPGRTGCTRDDFRVPQIYEYTLYQEQDGEWVEIDRRRKTTICTIDDSREGRLAELACLRTRVIPFYGCGCTQGVSRGWADDYFRGLTGQYVVIGENVGRFKLNGHLDPDDDLQAEDLADSERDADPSNNFVDAIFIYDGTEFVLEEIVHYFDLNGVCPPNSK